VEKLRHLKKALTEYKPHGYQIELAVNQYMMTKNKRVFWMSSNALNTYPIQKRGFIRGIWKIITMQMEILSYIGFINFFKQEMRFCKKEFRQIKNVRNK
jgi:hypothetical protein